jgi:regulation of enolase protein 1 (concanavalin A-like superfamily)
MLVAWTAHHDNGWVTTVLETPSGTFSAWVAREGEALSVDYAEEGPENAKIAAEFALKSKTGHAECSPQCSGWQLHTHELRVSDDADE